MRGNSLYVPPGIERERHDFARARAELSSAIDKRDALIAKLLEMPAAALRSGRADDGLAQWVATLDYETAERLAVLAAERAVVAQREAGAPPPVHGAGQGGGTPK
jgi:hypothetical protein